MKFIKLSTVILNPKYINKIYVKNDIVNVSVMRFYLNGFVVAGSGFTYGHGDTTYSFSKENEPKDYEKMLKWIEDNSE